MGQFSWLDCVTGEPILDDVRRVSYVLVPKDFGGGHIAENCYDGYGHFGRYDIYELVLEWNKKYIPQYIKQMQAGKWRCDSALADVNDLMAYYKDQPLDIEPRVLGITLACYDEDNARLKYPIKITYDPYAVYEDCKPSKSDPNQGWGSTELSAMVFIISGTLPDGMQLDRTAVTQLVTNIFSDVNAEDLEIIIQNADDLRDWYGDDFEDNEFGVRIHALIDSDDDDYLVGCIYDKFEDAGYVVDDVYCDYD